MSSVDLACRTAAVVGVAGLELSPEEQSLLRETRPLGFILFARNCRDGDQIRHLVQCLRDSLQDAAAPVFIDQEGGRVTRLKPPTWPAITAAGPIGALAKEGLAQAREAAWLQARLIAADLEPLGITVNCAPCLDLHLPGQTTAIGDRAYAEDPVLVASLGKTAIEGFIAGGVLPVIKHMPGHGRAVVDSHLELPRVAASLSELRAADWRPFGTLADHTPFGMTAHIQFSALDKTRPATQSATIIQEVIRGEIGFKGALLSDDLSMEALGGSLGERAAAAMAAGCDLALHCNGDFEEMRQVLAAAGPLSGEALDRVRQALAWPASAKPFDAADGRARLEALLQGRSGSARAVG